VALYSIIPTYLSLCNIKPQPGKNERAALLHQHKPKKTSDMFKDIKWGHQLVALAVVIVGVVIAHMIIKQTVEADGTIKASLGIGDKKED
jgi:hypothetical protein